jgi:hypothetical protein
MTTPDEITALFALASESFTRISGQPSDDDLNEILLVVKPILHNIDYDMDGPNNLIGLVEDATAYTTTWGQAWADPARPAAYDTNIKEDATRVVQNRMEAAHRVLIKDHAIYLAAEKAVAKFIRDAVEETYYKDLEDIVTFYNKVSAQALLAHLRLNCPGMESENLVALQTAMNGYYDSVDGIPEYIIKLEKARITLKRGKLPMSDPQVLAIADASVYASQHFVRANEDWQRVTPAGKTWTAWKTMYLQAHRDRARLIQAQGGGGNIGSANSAGTFTLPPTSASRLTEYLDNIANAATQDSSQLQLLIASNNTLIEQNRKLASDMAALSSRVSNATPTIAPTIPPTITPTVTPGTPRTPAQLLAKRLLKYDPNLYCYTHGFLVRHDSAACTHPNATHKRDATKADTKGGSEWNKGWELAGN